MSLEQLKANNLVGRLVLPEVMTEDASHSSQPGAERGALSPRLLRVASLIAGPRPKAKAKSIPAASRRGR